MQLPLPINTNKGDGHMRITEISPIKPVKPLTPAQSRVATLKRRVDIAKQALDSERRRQSVHKAQMGLQKAQAITP